MESRFVYQLDHPRLLKALLAFTAFGTFNTILRLIMRPFGPPIGFDVLVLLVIAAIPWIHYLNPSRIGAVVMKILCVIQAVASAIQLFLIFESEFQFSSGPGKWLFFFAAQIFSLVFHCLLFRAVNVHAENSDFDETAERLDSLSKDR